MTRDEILRDHNQYLDFFGGVVTISVADAKEIGSRCQVPGGGCRVAGVEADI